MTVPRNAIGAAVLKMLGTLGEARVVELTGKTVNALYKASNPNNSTCMAVRDVVALAAGCIVAGEPHGLHEAVEAEIRAEVAALGGRCSGPGVTLDQCLRRIAAEVGDVHRTVDRAMADGRLCAGDRHAITREINEAIEELQRLREAMEITGLRVA